MAGSNDAALAIAVSEAGGLVSLPCAMLTPEFVRRQLGEIEQRTTRPVNVNFFCHAPPQPKRRGHRGVTPSAGDVITPNWTLPPTPRLGSDPAQFADTMCELVEEMGASEMAA